jgi:cobalt-zinc-cadmium efflux system outer membrane protein
VAAPTAIGEAITLPEAIARAIAANPLLRARTLEARARGAEAAQTARPPNPTLTVEVEDLGHAAGSALPSQTTISVSQRFELGHKRALRTRLAALERDSAEWDLAIARADIEGRVALAFVAVLIADAELVLARVDAGTAREMAAAVRPGAQRCWL